jgi:hypothetical protein
MKVAGSRTQREGGTRLFDYVILQYLEYPSRMAVKLQRNALSQGGPTPNNIDMIWGLVRRVKTRNFQITRSLARQALPITEFFPGLGRLGYLNADWYCG